MTATECPICGRRPCQFPRCPMLAAEGKPYCWRHWGEMKGRIR